MHVDAIGYELPAEVVTSAELEERLALFYRAARVPTGQIESLTGIVERRWWEPDYPVSAGATAAAIRALEGSNVSAGEIGVLIYAGVCRELFEPATACRVASGLGIGGDAAVFDLSNACLGVLSGMVEVANRIELGQVRAGLVVSCESAREIVDVMIGRMVESGSVDLFRTSLATLTGGSGAVAVLLTNGSFGASGHRLVGGVARAAPEHHALCRWGFEAASTVASANGRYASQFMSTDAVAVLKHGVELGRRTWEAFLQEVGWSVADVDKIICHQVGSGHREAILGVLGVDPDREFLTYPYLGNIGTVSLPITAALADEREFLNPGDRVAMLGIGSGLNCLMLGVEW